MRLLYLDKSSYSRPQQLSVSLPNSPQQVLPPCIFIPFQPAVQHCNWTNCYCLCTYLCEWILAGWKLCLRKCRDASSDCWQICCTISVVNHGFYRNYWPRKRSKGSQKLDHLGWEVQVLQLYSVSSWLCNLAFLDRPTAWRGWVFLPQILKTKNKYTIFN